MTRSQEQRTAFIKAWQEAESLQEVARQLGVTEQQAISKASYFRRRLGVKLKKFRSLSNEELQELRRIAGSYRDLQ
jgi:DNA-directed RNA polymerase specialized sigma24 family protein